MNPPWHGLASGNLLLCLLCLPTGNSLGLPIGNTPCLAHTHHWLSNTHQCHLCMVQHLHTVQVLLDSLTGLRMMILMVAVPVAVPAAVIRAGRAAEVEAEADRRGPQKAPASTAARSPPKTIVKMKTMSMLLSQVPHTGFLVEKTCQLPLLKGTNKHIQSAGRHPY